MTRATLFLAIFLTPMLGGWVRSLQADETRDKLFQKALTASGEQYVAARKAILKKRGEIGPLLKRKKAQP